MRSFHSSGLLGLLGGLSDLDLALAQRINQLLDAGPSPDRT